MRKSPAQVGAVPNCSKSEQVVPALNQGHQKVILAEGREHDCLSFDGGVEEAGFQPPKKTRNRHCETLSFHPSPALPIFSFSFAGLLHGQDSSSSSWEKDGGHRETEGSAHLGEDLRGLPPQIAPQRLDRRLHLIERWLLARQCRSVHLVAALSACPQDTVKRFH